jgi:tetratricopeptide (TPR) repeat protein
METTDTGDAKTEAMGDGETSLPGDDAPDVLEQPPEILRDRYELGQVLGRGGLGVVISAHDRQLGRRVAIKLIRATSYAGAERSRAADRMVLEAQALAQLSHENVVSVFDVGSYALPHGERGVFVVMELLEGPALSQWLRTSPPVAEILRVFRLAGEGLAAAHRRGLVHRDFKPANVVLDARGIPKVVDFGLAMTAHPGWETVRGADDSGSGGSSSGMMLGQRVTQTGIVLGTPRYMAPEQHMGESIGPTADQYAFCVSLWEALRGSPVFDDETFEELARAKRRGRWSSAAEDRTPAALVPVLQRGLSPEPTARWPDMPALLAALRPRSSRPRALALLGGLAVVGSLAAAWGMGDGGCDAPPGPFTVEVRVALEQRLGTTTSAEELRLVEARASQRGIAIAEGFVHACEAHRRQEIDAAQLDRRVACLRRASSDLGGALAIVTESETLTSEQAFDTIVALRPVSDCGDDARLALQLPPPSDPTVAAEVERLRAEMGRVASLATMGRTDEARERHEQALVRAEALGYRPVVVELLQQQGYAELQAGDYEQAKAVLERTLMEAEEIGHDAIAAQAASALVFVVGIGQSRYAEGLRLAETAQALIHRAGDPPLTLARLHGAIGAIENGEMRYDEAIREYEHAIAILRSATDPDPGELTVLLGGLAATLQRQGNLEAAAEKQREVLAIREEMLVPTHPSIGLAALNLGNTLGKQQKWAEAEAFFLRSIEIFDRKDRPTPNLAYPLLGLGVVYKKQGRYDDAAPLRWPRRRMVPPTRW